MRGVVFAMGVWAAAPAHACDIEALTTTLSDMAGQTGDVARGKAAAAVASACTLRPRVHDMLELLPKTSFSDLHNVDLSAAEDDAAAWEAACPGGTTTLTSALKQSGGVRMRTLYSGCDLQRFGLATEDQFASAAGAPLLAILVAKHLDEHRVHAGVAAPLVRAIAGLESSSSGAGPGTHVWSRGKRLGDEAAALKWNELDEAQWVERAAALVALCDLALSRPTAERREHQDAEYRVCSQAGRASDNANANDAPRFREVSGQTVNWGYYVAAAAATGQAMLLEHEPDKQLVQAISQYIGLIKSGKLPAAPPS